MIDDHSKGRARKSDDVGAPGYSAWQGRYYPNVFFYLEGGGRKSCIKRKGEYTILPSKDDCGKKGGASGKNPSRNGAKESRSKRREKNR